MTLYTGCELWIVSVSTCSDYMYLNETISFLCRFFVATVLYVILY